MSISIIPDWFSLLSNRQKLRAVWQRCKDMITYNFCDLPVDRTTILENWIPAEYIEAWNTWWEKIFYNHGLFGNSRVFERQMMSARLRKFHHIWLDYFNIDFIKSQRTAKIKDPFEISENYQNEFIKSMWREWEKFHRVWCSLWWERMLRTLFKNPDVALSMTVAWPAWLWQEEIKQIKGANFFWDLSWNRDVQIQFFINWFKNPAYLPPKIFENWFAKYVNKESYKPFILYCIIPFKKSSIDSPDIEWNKRRLTQISEAWIPINLQRWKLDKITPIEHIDTWRELAWDGLIHEYVSEDARHAVYIDDYRWFNKNQKEFFDKISK